ncbi:MAG TPA: BA14K family protein [Bradyrhizobium sp.]|uniref:BA14K family protein n=1 Tax=Bradyrhizobium sp. TaxID=376 RepID=UPI002D7E15CB|nr:BA14K family protein [Bradyrhizobium sp.]HET7886876.1 BA14K family protein [Bradyrhizobium sp.]
MGGARMGGGPRMQPSMGAQANVGARGSANFAASGNTNFAARGNQRIGGNAQFAEGDRGVLGGGQFRDDRRRFGRGAGFAAGAAAAGVATGAAIAAGDYGYGYDPYVYGDNYAYDTGYYGDSYAYDSGVTFDVGLPVVAFDQPAAVEGPVAVGGDASYCAQRYRSWDPASGTYLGFDGLRHPCP